MGEAKRRKQLDENFGKPRIFQILIDLLKKGGLEGSIEETIFSLFVMLQKNSIVYADFSSEAFTEQEKAQYKLRSNHPVKLAGFNPKDEAIPEIPDLHHLIQETDFSQSHLLALVLPRDFNGSNTIIMELSLTTIDSEIQKFEKLF